MTFPADEGGARASIIFQLSERDVGWSPSQLVSTYWADFMRVTVALPGGAGAAFVAQRQPAAPVAVINPLSILLPCAGASWRKGYDGRPLPALAPHHVAQVVEDFFAALKTLLISPDPSASHPDIYEKHAAWLPLWNTAPAQHKDALAAWSLKKDAQERALIAEMGSLLGTRAMGHTTRGQSSLGYAANSLRKNVWRFLRCVALAPLSPRAPLFVPFPPARPPLTRPASPLPRPRTPPCSDKHEGRIKYDLPASRAALVALLRDPAHAAQLPWGVPGSRAIASQLDAWGESPTEEAGDGGETVATFLTGSTADTLDGARGLRRAALFQAVSVGAPFRDISLRAGAPGEPLQFCEGLAAALGHEGAESQTVARKTCLRSHLVDPSRENVAWFRGVATTVSRSRWWGSTLGTAALIRELDADPTGGSLPVAPSKEGAARISATYWVHAAKVGGYADAGRTRRYEPALLRAFDAPREEAGFAGAAAPGAPHAPRDFHSPEAEAAAEAARGSAHGNSTYVVLNYAMKDYHTAYVTALYTNFPARLSAAASYWCATHLPPLFTAKAHADRTRAIVCAVLGTPCDAPPHPAAALHFVPQHREQLFGAAGHAHAVAAPTNAAGAGDEWLRANPTRVLIASAHLLRAAEAAWDKEVAQGRCAAWRDTSALRAAGGVAEVRAGAREGGGAGRGGGEVDELGAPEARQDAAARAQSAAAAAVEQHAGALLGADPRGAPPFHPPARGIVPPALFSLTPHASINVAHARFDAAVLRARLGMEKDDPDFTMGAVLLTGGREKAPLGASFTTDGVVLSALFRTVPDDPPARACVAVAEPKRRAAERAAAPEGGAAPAPRGLTRPRAAGQRVSENYLATLEPATVDRIYKVMLGGASSEAAKAAMAKLITSTAAHGRPKNITASATRKVLAGLRLLQKDIADCLTDAEKVTAEEGRAAGEPQAAATKRPRAASGGGGGGGGGGASASRPAGSSSAAAGQPSAAPKKARRAASAASSRASPPPDAAPQPCCCEPDLLEGCLDCECVTAERPCGAGCACNGCCAYSPQPAAPPPRRQPGRAHRATQRRAAPPPQPTGASHFNGDECGDADCPAAGECEGLRRFFVGTAPDGALAEDRWRFLSNDPGEGNLATIAEYVTVGEGNRLGCGARCPDTPAGRARAARRAAQRLARGAANPRGERVATYVLTRGELERKSGKVKHLAQSAKWTREVAAEHALLSSASRKTARPGRLAEYHRVAGATADGCWRNREKRRISRAAFGVWSRSEAALDAFWAGVLRGRARDGTLGKADRTVLGYGDWGGGFGAPTARVRKSAERVFRNHGRGRVVELREYNTSKTCHCCGDVLQGVVHAKKNFKRGAPAGAVDRGLKRCARSSCSSFLDRDVNAALNLLKVLLAQLRGEERPTHLLPDSALVYPSPLNHLMVVGRAARRGVQ